MSVEGNGGGGRLVAVYQQAKQVVIRAIQWSSVMGLLLLFLYLNFGPSVNS